MHEAFKPGSLFGVVVRGPQLEGLGIRSGDLLVCDSRRAEALRADDLVVALESDRLVVCRREVLASSATVLGVVVRRISAREFAAVMESQRD